MTPPSARWSTPASARTSAPSNRPRPPPSKRPRALRLATREAGPRTPRRLAGRRHLPGPVLDREGPWRGPRRAALDAGRDRLSGGSRRRAARARLRPDGQPWRVAVEVPDASDAHALALPLRDLSIATSGDYRRHAGSGDARYAHTIDPRDGQPVRNGVASVTVLHADCMQADALATALTVLGETEGLDLARRHGLAALSSCAKPAASGSPPPRRSRRWPRNLERHDPAPDCHGRRGACWLLLCAWAWRRARERARETRARQALDQPPRAALVAHASQTGCAETLAGQTADSLRAGGLDVRRGAGPARPGGCAATNACCSWPAPTAKAIRPTPPPPSPA